MKILLATLLLASTAASAHTEAWQRKYLLASRNTGGTYSLPNPPVITGTTITSLWANSTLTDLATEITNSLDRSGRGAMTGPLRLNGGANAAIPDLSWGVETNTGFYRAAAGDIHFGLAGVDNMRWTSLTMSLQGTTPITFQHDALGALGGMWIGVTGTPAVTNYTILGDTANSYVNAPLGGTGHLRVNNVDVLTWTASTISTAQPVFLNAPVTIGTNGIAISASIRGTLVVGSGSLPANSCVNQSVTVTGAAVGAECASGYTAVAPINSITGCSVTAINVCTVTSCNPTTGAILFPANTLSCRVFNP